MKKHQHNNRIKTSWPVLLLLILGMSTRAEASGRGQVLDDLCQKFFLTLGFSQGTAEFMSGLSALVFLVAVIYVIYRQNRAAPPDE